MTQSSLIFVLLVEDIICGLFTSHVDCDIMFDQIQKEIPPIAIISIVSVLKNTRIIGAIRKGKIIRSDKGLLILENEEIKT